LEEKAKKTEDMKKELAELKESREAEKTELQKKLKELEETMEKKVKGMQSGKKESKTRRRSRRKIGRKSKAGTLRHKIRIQSAAPTHPRRIRIRIGIRRVRGLDSCQAPHTIKLAAKGR
jgi:hypothetical protein